MTVWMNPFRSVMRAKAKLGRLEAQLHGVEQAVASVETRLARLEQLVGFGDAGENEPADTPIGKLLDARLTHLEARLLTYLEGPYFARVAKLSSDDAPPSGRNRG
jgi:hypothetical protein